MGSDSQTSWSTRIVVSIVLAALGITGGAGYLLLGGSGKQVQMPIAPVTVDADADVIIQSTAATQVPLVVQGAASQSDNLQEWHDSTGANTAYVGSSGSIYGSNFIKTDSTSALGSSLFLANATTAKWSSDATYYGTPDLSISRKSANVFGIGDGGTSDAIRVGAAGRIYGNAVAAPTASATVGDHTTNGSLITVKTTAAHNICAGQTVTLAGWTWSDGGGVVDGTWLVGTTPSTTTFTIAPTSCPTTGTNPSVVGTIVVSAQIGLGGLTVRPDADADVVIQSTSATQVPLVVNGAVGQSDNFIEVKDSAGTDVFKIYSEGAVYASSYLQSAAAGVGLYLGTVGVKCPASQVIGLTDINARGDALRIGASGRIYGNAVSAPTAHATASNHTSDGTSVTITTTAVHHLLAGQTITLAGWTWSDGGGVINGTMLVGTTPTATTFTCTPSSTAGTVCPTTGTNPSVVGTITVNAQLQLGAAPLKADASAVHVGGVLREEQNAIATTSTDGIVIANNTPATVGATRQFSPRLRWRANVWDADSSVNDTWDFWFEESVTTANDTSSALILYSSKNSAAASTYFSVTSGGTTSVANLNATSRITNTFMNLTAGTMTATRSSMINTVWHQYSWTNAMVTAGGAVTSFDVTVATLPAKTQVRQALLVINTAGTNMGGATFTATLGTDAEFDNFLLSGSMLAAANTVYGDIVGEVGTSLDATAYVPFLPSWTATTAVKVRFATDGAGGKTLADVLTSTGSVYLLTETLP